MATIATQVRNGLGIVSEKGKDTWRFESKTGEYYGFMPDVNIAKLGDVLKSIGFVEVVAGQEYAYKGEHLRLCGKFSFGYYVEISAKLTNKKWCEENA